MVRQYASPKGEQIQISYTYKHPLGIRHRKAFVFCDCLIPARCSIGTVHVGEDRHNAAIVTVRFEQTGWIALKS